MDVGRGCLYSERARNGREQKWTTSFAIETSDIVLVSDDEKRRGDLDLDFVQSIVTCWLLLSTATRSAF